MTWYQLHSVVQELKDRKKIRYLLSVHGIAADQDETTYFKDTLDRRFVRGPAKTSLQQQQQQQQQRNIEEFIEDTLEGDVEALKLRVKSLQAQLDEQVGLDSSLPELDFIGLVTIVR